MATSKIKGGEHNTNIESQINLNSYTSFSNPYVFPSDGYVVVYASSSTSSSAYAKIMGETDSGYVITIGAYGGNSYPSFATFVRKGMRCYVANISNNGQVVFHPLT